MSKKPMVTRTETAKRSREGTLRMDQRMNESADIFAMRAFAKALPYIDQQTALAAAQWMYSKASDSKTWRGR